MKLIKEIIRMTPNVFINDIVIGFKVVLDFCQKVEFIMVLNTDTGTLLGMTRGYF